MVCFVVRHQSCPHVVRLDAESPYVALFSRLGPGPGPSPPHVRQRRPGIHDVVDVNDAVTRACNLLSDLIHHLDLL